VASIDTTAAMNAITLIDNAYADNSIEQGVVSWGMMCEKAVDIAASKGRSAHDVSKFDWEQARQELMEDQSQA